MFKNVYGSQPRIFSNKKNFLKIFVTFDCAKAFSIHMMFRLTGFAE